MTDTESALPADNQPDATPTAQLRLVSIKFRAAGRHYDFNAQNLTLSLNDKVVVETDRGRALGTVAGIPREVSPDKAPEGLKNVLRHAMAEDLAMAANFTAKEEQALRFCRERIHERKLEMKLVRAEYLFDGSKIIFYFTADGRIDFRELVKDLAHHFHTRIEMRQIGVRDEAKLTGGIGVCGRELCCCTYLTEFAPVSVKMAKEQDLALNPTKISGQCGRLLCCLGYEYETYCDLKKSLPKCGRKVVVDGREGEVIEQQILRQTVTVNFGPNQRVILTAEEIEKGVMNQRQPLSASPLERPTTASLAKAAVDRPQRDTQSRDQQRNNRGGQQNNRQKPQDQKPQPGSRPSPVPEKSQQKAASQSPAVPAKPVRPQDQPETASSENRRKRQRNRRRNQRKGQQTPSGDSGE